MNTIKKAIFAAVAIAGFSTGAQAALITNDNITLTSTSYTGNASIGSGIEFSDIAGYLSFDFSTTGLIVKISESLPNKFVFSSTLGSFVFSGFDTDISTFTLTSNSPQFKNFDTPNYALNSNNTITLNFAGVAPANDNAELTFAITTKTTAPAPGNSVPEPATVALLGLGLLGVATARRKSAKN